MSAIQSKLKDLFSSRKDSTGYSFDSTDDAKKFAPYSDKSALSNVPGPPRPPTFTSPTQTLNPKNGSGGGAYNRLSSGVDKNFRENDINRLPRVNASEQLQVIMEDVNRNLNNYAEKTSENKENKTKPTPRVQRRTKRQAERVSSNQLGDGESFKASQQSIIDEINASDSDVMTTEELKKILGSDSQTDPDIAYLEREVARRERIQMQMQKEIHLNEKLLGSQKTEKLKTSKVIRSELIDSFDREEKDSPRSTRYLDKNASSTAFMLNSSGSSTTSSGYQNSEDRETALKRNRLLKELVKMKNTQNELEMIIEEQRRQIAVENMKLEDALIVNESINNFQSQRPITPSSTLPPPPPELLANSEESDSADLKFINDRILPGYPTRITKYTVDSETNTIRPVKQFVAVPSEKPKHVAGAGNEPKPSDLYLETTENLLDEEGNLFSSKKSVKYIGKTLVNKVGNDHAKAPPPQQQAIKQAPESHPEPKVIEMSSKPLSIKVIDNSDILVKNVNAASQPSPPIRIELPDSSTIDIIRMPTAPPRTKSKKKEKAATSETGSMCHLTLRELEAIEKVLEEYGQKDSDSDRRSKYYLNGQEISLENVRQLKKSVANRTEPSARSKLESKSSESVATSSGSAYKTPSLEKSTKKKFAPPPPNPVEKVEPPFRLSSESDSSTMFKPVVKKAIETETKVTEPRRRALVSPITETETDPDVEISFKKVPSPQTDSSDTTSTPPTKPVSILKKPGAKTGEYKCVKVRKDDPVNKRRSKYIMVYPKNCPKSLKSIDEEGSGESDSLADDAIAEKILFNEPLDGKCVKCIEIKKPATAEGTKVTKKYIVTEPAASSSSSRAPTSKKKAQAPVAASNTFPRRSASVKVSSTGSVRRMVPGAQKAFDADLYADEEEARLARTNTNRRMRRYLTRVDWDTKKIERLEKSSEWLKRNGGPNVRSQSAENHRREKKKNAADAGASSRRESTPSVAATLPRINKNQFYRDLDDSFDENYEDSEADQQTSITAVVPAKPRETRETRDTRDDPVRQRFIRDRLRSEERKRKREIKKQEKAAKKREKDAQSAFEDEQGKPKGQFFKNLFNKNKKSSTLDPRTGRAQTSRRMSSLPINDRIVDVSDDPPPRIERNLIRDEDEDDDDDDDSFKNEYATNMRKFDRSNIDYSRNQASGGGQNEASRATNGRGAPPQQQDPNHLYQQQQQQRQQQEHNQTINRDPIQNATANKSSFKKEQKLRLKEEKKAIKMMKAQLKRDPNNIFIRQQITLLEQNSVNPIRKMFSKNKKLSPEEQEKLQQEQARMQQELYFQQVMFYQQWMQQMQQQPKNEAETDQDKPDETNDNHLHQEAPTRSQQSDSIQPIPIPQMRPPGNNAAMSANNQSKANQNQSRLSNMNAAMSTTASVQAISVPSRPAPNKSTVPPNIYSTVAPSANSSAAAANSGFRAVGGNNNNIKIGGLENKNANASKNPRGNNSTTWNSENTSNDAVTFRMTNTELHPGLEKDDTLSIMELKKPFRYSNQEPHYAEIADVEPEEEQPPKVPEVKPFQYVQSKEYEELQKYLAEHQARDEDDEAGSEATLKENADGHSNKGFEGDDS